jgi:hypothetical protein
MEISKIKVGKEYKLTNSHFKGDQKVKVIGIEKDVVHVVYTSNDCSKGRVDYMNEIECERYLHEV